MSLGSVFFLTQFTHFLFPLITWISIYLDFFFLFDMHNTVSVFGGVLVSLIQSKTECPLMAWPCPPRRIKPLFFTDYNHYFFFFAEFCIFSYPGVYFQVFFLRNINWKLYYLNLHILKYLLFVFVQDSLPGVLVLFPSKHLETDHLKMPSVI